MTIDALRDAGINTIQDILDYVSDGSRLFYINGVFKSDEAAIMQLLENKYKIHCLYNSLTCEEYLEIFNKRAFDEWEKYREKMEGIVRPIVYETLKGIGVSTRVANAYGRVNLNTVGDVLAFRYAGGDLQHGIRNIGVAGYNELIYCLDRIKLNCKYDELPNEFKPYIMRRIKNLRLYKMEFPWSISLRLTKEGFNTVGELFDYLAKGNTLEQLLNEEGASEVCEKVINNLYINGVPFTREVRENGEADNS